MMTTLVQAVYKNGVFTPARSLDFSDHEKVCLLVMPLSTWKKVFSGLLVAVATMAFAAGCDRRPARWHAALADEMLDLAVYYPKNNVIALTEYEKLIADYPDAPDLDAAYYSRARIRHQLLEWRWSLNSEARRVAEAGPRPMTDEEVIAAYDELDTRFPNSSFHYLVRQYPFHYVQEYPLAFVVLARKPHPETRGHLDILASGPETRDYLDILGAFESGNDSHAQELATGFLAAYPESPRRARVAYLLARCYLRLFDYTNAEPAYRAVIAQFPGTDEAKRAKNRLAWVLFARLGRPAEARALYREMLTEHRDHPTYGWVLVDLAECELSAGDTDAAMGWFEQAALLNDDYYLWNGERAWEYATAKLPPAPRRRYLVESGVDGGRPR